MTDLDLDGLAAEARAAAGRPDGQGTMSLRPQEVLALIDRIKELEAERDYAAGQVDIERQERAITVGRMNDERKRADRAEARLVRLIDDSMAERLADSLGGSDEFTPAEHLDPHGELRALAGAALAAIRAVAADGEVPDAERYPIGHRLCTQDCKQQEDGEHCFACREPWPCVAADEQGATDA